MGLTVAAAPLTDGSDVFIELAWFDDAGVPSLPFAAEGLLESALLRLAALLARAGAPTDAASQKVRYAESWASAVNAFS